MADIVELIEREKDLVIESIEVRQEINDIEELPKNQRILKSFRYYVLKTRDRALDYLIEVTCQRIDEYNQLQIKLQQQQQQQQQ